MKRAAFAGHFALRTQNRIDSAPGACDNNNGNYSVQGNERMDITKIDPNFLKGTVFSEKEFTWYDLRSEPFEVRGLAVCEGERFLRLPEELLPRVSEGVQVLAHHTAGGHVRFRTDALRVAVRASSLYPDSIMNHMALTGSKGLDIYVDGEYCATIRPGITDEWFEGVCELKAGVKDIEINMPLYNGLTRLLIGISAGANVLAPRPYRFNEPVVYYGSSITQGGCASRPGNCYQGFLSRWLDADQVNLGFSGSAKGEAEMAEYIAGLPMCAFVFDYDHNAPDVEHLRRTHEPFFQLIRRARPELPVIFVTKPDGNRDPHGEERRELIYANYEHARENGDAHVWFVDGRTLFGEHDHEDCTVDGCHPNDLGFYRMAQAIYPALKQALSV